MYSYNFEFSMTKIEVVYLVSFKLNRYIMYPIVLIIQFNLVGIIYCSYFFIKLAHNKDMQNKIACTKLLFRFYSHLFQRSSYILRTAIHTFISYQKCIQTFVCDLFLLL